MSTTLNKRWLILLFPIFIIACDNKSNNEKVGSDIISGSLTVTDSLLIYATWANEVVVENFKSKKILFRKHTTDKCYSRPLLLEGNLYFPDSDSIFNCVDISSSKVVWKAALGGRCSQFYAANNTIVANEKHYGIVGINMLTGKRKYELRYKYNDTCTLPDLSPYRLSGYKNSFYVCDWQCTSVSAFNILTGEKLWDKKSKSSLSNVALINDVVFWGRNELYKGGSVTLLDPVTGNVLHEERATFEANFNPISYNKKLYYYKYDGTLNEFDVEAKKSKVVYRFNKGDDVSGHQMYLLNGKLYYSSQFKGYELDLSTFKNKVFKSISKDIYGVYQSKDNSVEIIY